MASGDTLAVFNPTDNLFPVWAFVAFTSGSTEPSLGDTIWGDTSDENGILEFISLESGTWGGGDAAGYMLLSNLSGVVGDWTSGENFTANSSTPGNHGTLTALPVDCFATFDTRNNKPRLDYDATANEVGLWQNEMPNHYGGNGVTLTGRVSANTTTLDFSFKAFLMSITSDADDVDTKNFAAPQSNQAIDVANAIGETVDFDITFTDGAQMDSIAKNEMFYLLVMRDAQDGTHDDATGDAELVSLVLRET